MNYIVNFKYYDERGRRLSIFGEQKGDQLLVTVLTCSKNDIFSKKEAHRLYNNPILPHHVIEIQSGDTAQYTLNRWAKGRYYKLVVRDSMRGRDIFVKCIAPGRFINKFGAYRIPAKFLLLSKH